MRTSPPRNIKRSSPVAARRATKASGRFTRQPEARHILNNPAISAPIPGLINRKQIDNAVLAIRERRQPDLKEKAELEAAARRRWANLRPHYRWLRDWEHV
jgi:hypothetical protein